MSLLLLLLFAASVSGGLAPASLKSPIAPVVELADARSLPSWIVSRNSLCESRSLLRSLWLLPCCPCPCPFAACAPLLPAPAEAGSPPRCSLLYRALPVFCTIVLLLPCTGCSYSPYHSLSGLKLAGWTTRGERDSWSSPLLLYHRLYLLMLVLMLSDRTMKSELLLESLEPGLDPGRANNGTRPFAHDAVLQRVVLTSHTVRVWWISHVCYTLSRQEVKKVEMPSTLPCSNCTPCRQSPRSALQGDTLHPRCVL